MVISEQPLENAETLEKRIINRDFRKGRLPNVLNKLFCGKFFKEFRKKIYWTHYIKCHGKLRGREAPLKVKEKACADRFLLKEMEVFKPRLIITVGSKASSYVLKDIPKRLGLEIEFKDWRELLWRELVAVARSETPDLPEIYGAKIFALAHPSGANPLKYFNERLKPIIKQLLEIYL